MENSSNTPADAGKERRSSFQVPSSDSRERRKDRKGVGGSSKIFQLGVLTSLDVQASSSGEPSVSFDDRSYTGLPSSRRRRSSLLKGRIRTSKHSSLESLGTGDKVRSMTYTAFAKEALFERGGGEPDVKHALALRKHVARWCGVMEGILGSLTWGTGDEDKGEIAGRALRYLDGVVERRLLPLLQASAVDGVTASLERVDAFEPKYKSNTLQDVLVPDVTEACRCLIDRAAPLFEALSLVPVDGEAFGLVLEVLEHSVLTFLSRAKARAAEVAGERTAIGLLGGDVNEEGDRNPYGRELGRQGGFEKMLASYIGGGGKGGGRIRDRGEGLLLENQGEPRGIQEKPKLGRTTTTEEERADEEEVRRGRGGNTWEKV